MAMLPGIGIMPSVAGGGGGGSGITGVLSKSYGSPPGGVPTLGDAYIVASPASGLWATYEDYIAAWDGAAWVFTYPTLGQLAYVQDEGIYYTWDGSAWVAQTLAPPASGAITSGMLGNGAVVSGSIASGSISLNHLASGVLQNFALSSGVVRSGHLGDGAVVSGSIASGQIGAYHLAPNSLWSGAFGSGQISSANIASGTLVAELSIARTFMLMGA